MRTLARPESRTADSMALRETLLPCPCISSMSSPVYEDGPFMKRKTASSMISALGSELSLTTLPVYAWRGSISSGQPCIRRLISASLSGPLTLTIPIPPSPGAVDIAVIVSAMLNVPLSLIRLVFYHTDIKRASYRATPSLYSLRIQTVIQPVLWISRNLLYCA